ncbi:MAG: peptidyl-prolyl cis-trans isomerase [bacterium]|nr:peptidyl-prolyl cis-trans isomerase [bacterium]
MTCRERFLGGLAATVLFMVAGPVAASPGAADNPVPLAVVGSDTLTTVDLEIELALMNARNSANAPVKLDDPQPILRRLTQNQLLVQEGLRMGLDQEAVVRNQAWSVVRQECMKALLDSVALSVPESQADYRDARRLAVQSYLDDLARTWGASVDSVLLRSLDYGSAEPAMQKRLRDSSEMLGRLPGNRTFTVADFTRQLRFTEFHGLVGKPEAAQRRDEIMREFMADAVTARQIRAQKMDQTPRMRMLYRRFERAAILEEALRVLAQIDFAPADPEVSHFYRQHQSEYMSSPRLKMASLKARSKEDAEALRERILKGASVRWLTGNDKRVVEGAPPFPESWLFPEQMGIKAEDLRVGFTPEAYEVPEGWVVAQVVEVEPAQPLPLAQCRDRILARMRQDASRQQMLEILARLEAESPVRILPGAEAEVRKVVAESYVEPQPAASPQQP